MALLTVVVLAPPQPLAASAATARADAMAPRTRPGTAADLPALLPQPGGLEGLTPVLEEGDPRDLSVAKRPDPGNSGLKLDPAATPVMHLERGYDLISRLDELLWLVADRLPRPDEGVDDAGNVLGPVHASFGADRTRKVEDKIGRRSRHRAGEVPAIQRLEDATNDLHVLLRHRLRSISRYTALENELSRSG